MLVRLSTVAMLVSGNKAYRSCSFNPFKVLSSFPHLRLRERPPTTLSADVLPEQFDWRNVNGTSYVTRTLNQHIPVYCGSCWAHAAISSYSDRLKIMNNASWPEIQLSVQYPLNCLPYTGTCNGGSDLLLYEAMTRTGIPDDTCESYIAKDEPCNQINRCRNCFGPPGKGYCFAQPTYSVYKAAEYGFFTNGSKVVFEGRRQHRVANMVSTMKTEIFKNGPISCGVDAEVIFDLKPNEIMTGPGVEINHVVSVSGWGVEKDEEYWIVRNSWGTYWASHGWGRISTVSTICFTTKPSSRDIIQHLSKHSAPGLNQILTLNSSRSEPYPYPINQSTQK